MEKVDKLKLKNDWKQRGYSFGVFRDPPGQVWADFVHKTDELVVLAEGEIEIEIEDIDNNLQELALSIVRSDYENLSKDKHI